MTACPAPQPAAPTADGAEEEVVELPPILCTDFKGHMHVPLWITPALFAFVFVACLLGCFNKRRPAIITPPVLPSYHPCLLGCFNKHRLGLGLGLGTSAASSSAGPRSPTLQPTPNPDPHPQPQSPTRASTSTQPHPHRNPNPDPDPTILTLTLRRELVHSAPTAVHSTHGSKPLRNPKRVESF